MISKHKLKKQKSDALVWYIKELKSSLWKLLTLKRQHIMVRALATTQDSALGVILTKSLLFGTQFLYL